MHGTRAAIATAIIAIGIGALGLGTARATTYGNPAPDIKEGDLAPGIALSDDREELFLDWGLSDAGTLRVILAEVDLGGDDGTELGIGYRHKSSKRANVGDAELRLGGLVIYRLGEADNTAGVEYSQLDLGFGGTTTLADNLDVFGIAIYRRIETDTPQKSVSDSDVGVVVGAEFKLGEGILVGGEFHIGLENDDFGFYAQLKF